MVPVPSTARHICKNNWRNFNFQRAVMRYIVLIPFWFIPVVRHISFCFSPIMRQNSFIPVMWHLFLFIPVMGHISFCFIPFMRNISSFFSPFIRHLSCCFLPNMRRTYLSSFYSRYATYIFLFLPVMCISLCFIPVCDISLWYLFLFYPRLSLRNIRLWTRRNGERAPLSNPEMSHTPSDR